jgi:hypothetical protein
MLPRNASASDGCDAPDQLRAHRGDETLTMAVYMGAGPSVMYAAKALEAVDQIAARDKPNP